MQTLQPSAFPPENLNVVELAALLEDERLKTDQRKILQQALREFVTQRSKARAPTSGHSRDMVARGEFATSR